MMEQTDRRRKIVGTAGTGLIVIGGAGMFCICLPGMPCQDFVDLFVLFLSPSALVLGVLLLRMSQAEGWDSLSRDEWPRRVTRGAVLVMLIGCLPLLSLLLYLWITGEIVNEGNGIIGITLAMASLLAGLGAILVATLARWRNREKDRDFKQMRPPNKAL